MVQVMMQRDGHAELQKELQKAPRLAAHELDPAARDGHATLLHAACRYGRYECARALLALDTADMIPSRMETRRSGEGRNVTADGEATKERARAGKSGGGKGDASTSSGSASGGGTSGGSGMRVEAAKEASAAESAAAEIVAAHPLLLRKDRGGFTPLLMAAWCGHKLLVGMLLNAGAPIDDVGVPPLASSCGGKGPFDAATWAERKGYDAIVARIREASGDRERSRTWRRSLNEIKWMHADCLSMGAQIEQRLAQIAAKRFAAARAGKASVAGATAG